MDAEDFEQLVIAAVAALPEWVKSAMDNVAFVVETEARRARARELGIRAGDILLGLYEGIPRTERDSGYMGALPDKITLFQKPIEDLSGGDEGKLKQIVFDTVWHEVGHHFGLADADLHAREARKSASENLNLHICTEACEAV